jgi:putative DNA primase/helicase
MSELASLRRAETEKVKAFLTARTDHFRPPYGRRAADVPRQNVFAASTNDQQPFVDSTGNRRFWPVRCGQIDVEGIGRDRDQLWAEAYHLFKQGKVWWLDGDELNSLAAHEQGERYEEGVWDDLILDWTEDPRQREAPSNGGTVLVKPWDGSEPGKVTITDVLVHGIGKDKDRLTQADRNQVVRCLTHYGWTREQERSGCNRGKRFYVKPKQ